MATSEKHWLFNRLNLDKVSDAFKKYVELRLELFQIETKEQLLRAVSALILLVLMGVIGMLVLFFASLTASFYLNSALESSFLGFFIVASFYLTIILLLLIFKKRLSGRGGILAFLEKYLISDEDGEKTDQA